MMYKEDEKKMLDDKKIEKKNIQIFRILNFDRLEVMTEWEDEKVDINYFKSKSIYV